jgi:hypothetical protein
MRTLLKVSSIFSMVAGGALTIQGFITGCSAISAEQQGVGLYLVGTGLTFAMIVSPLIWVFVDVADIITAAIRSLMHIPSEMPTKEEPVGGILSISPDMRR